MRWRRIGRGSHGRWSIRRLMALVAVAAVALLVASELRDGLPPRFVRRALVARVARLRPGLSPAEARAILGVGRPWYRGGTGAKEGFIFETANVRLETYGIPRQRIFGRGNRPAAEVSLQFIVPPSEEVMGPARPEDPSRRWDDIVRTREEVERELEASQLWKARGESSDGAWRIEMPEEWPAPTNPVGPSGPFGERLGPVVSPPTGAWSTGKTPGHAL